MTKKLSAFESAFAAARKAGKGEFEFKGKKFTTRRADDRPAKAAPPRSKPTGSPGMGGSTDPTPSPGVRQGPVPQARPSTAPTPTTASIGQSRPKTPPPITPAVAGAASSMQPVQDRKAPVPVARPKDRRATPASEAFMRDTGGSDMQPVRDRPKPYPGTTFTKASPQVNAATTEPAKGSTKSYSPDNIKPSGYAPTKTEAEDEKEKKRQRALKWF